MAFKPCNFSLARVLEIHKEERQRGRMRRQGDMQRADMHPDRAHFIDRYEAAVQVALEKLIHLEATHPELLEPTP